MNNTAKNTGDYQRAVGEMVQREVYTCASQLISDLCNAGLYNNSCSFAELHYDILAQDDWEEAAEGAGWTYKDGVVVNIDTDHEYDTYESYIDCCQNECIEPYQREALEHWIVSGWLADRLEEHGEMVDKDIHGLTIWGRSCSGQSILLDRVICDIYDELHGE